MRRWWLARSEWTRAGVTGAASGLWSAVFGARVGAVVLAVLVAVLVVAIEVVGRLRHRVDDVVVLAAHARRARRVHDRVQPLLLIGGVLAAACSYGLSPQWGALAPVLLLLERLLWWEGHRTAMRVRDLLPPLA